MLRSNEDEGNQQKSEICLFSRALPLQGATHRLTLRCRPSGCLSVRGPPHPTPSYPQHKDMELEETMK